MCYQEKALDHNEQSEQSEKKKLSDYLKNSDSFFACCLAGDRSEKPVQRIGSIRFFQIRNMNFEDWIRYLLQLQFQIQDPDQ